MPVTMNPTLRWHQHAAAEPAYALALALAQAPIPLHFLGQYLPMQWL